MKFNPKIGRQLLHASVTVATMTTISRILGFARDVVIATVFGAAAGTDAFLVAFKIPNFFRRLFAEGAFAAAFVPVFKEYHSRGNNTELRNLAAHVSGTLAGILAAICLVGVVAAPLLVALFGMGLGQGDEAIRFAWASDMLRLTFPYLFCIALVAYAGGILNSLGRFAVPAFTPVWLNVCLISGALLASAWFDPPIYALAAAVLAAGIVQLLWQLPFLATQRLLVRPRWGWRHPGVQRILKLMVPALFGAGIAQLNLLIDTLIASFLPTGSISWLYFSDRLIELPLGIFGIAIATVLLPQLAGHHARHDRHAFDASLNWGISRGWFVTVPAWVGLAVLAQPILASLFQYGEFDAWDTQQASYSLIAYAAGLPAFAASKAAVNGFFAQQDTRTPVRIGVWVLVINVLLNLVLVGAFYRWLPNLPHVGLALATSIAAWLHMLLLIRALRKKCAWRLHAADRQLMLCSTIAALFMGLILLLCCAAPASWQNLSIAQRATELLVLLSIGVLTYLVGARCLGLRLNKLLQQT